MVDLLDPDFSQLRALVGLPQSPADNTALQYNISLGLWEEKTLAGLGIVHTDIDDFDAGVQANRLDQMAVPTASVNLNTQKIIGLLDPTLAQDAATKNYVDTTTLPSSLTDSFIFVGNGSNVAVGVAVSGDVAITNLGVITIENDAITTIKILDGAVNSAKILNDTILNIDINSAAAIAYSKLNLTTSIVNGDLVPGAFVSITGVGVQAQVLDMGTNKVTNAGAPTLGNDLTTKSYVDNLITGLRWKDPARVGSVANLVLSGEQTIDGILTSTDRILVKDQTTPSENGIYVTAAGAWTRSTDADIGTELEQAALFVQEGTVNADQSFVCTTDPPITIGVTAITFVQMSGLGQIIAGAGLTKTANTLDVIGTTNRILVNANSVDISPNYVGQATITTLGTIATGVWNGTNIALANIVNGTANQIIKTNAAGTALEFGVIGDANTATFTTTKISTLNKSLLNSAILYNDQNNSLGAFYLDVDDIVVPANPGTGIRRIFTDTATGKLSVRTSVGTTVSLEEGAGSGEVNTHSSLGGGTFALTAAVPKTGVNLNLISISNGDGMNAALATDVLTLAVSATVVQTDQANIFGDFAQTFKDNQLFIENPAGSFEYQLVASAIGADYTLNLPLITGNDTLAVLGLAQTFTEIQTFNENVIHAARNQEDKGADVASANIMTLGGDGNFFDITGTTTINEIVATNWQEGSEITIKFDGILIVTHSSGGTNDILLADSINMVTVVGDTLTLKFDGVDWIEISRNSGDGVGLTSAAEENSTPITDDSEIAIFGERRYTHFTMPTDFEFFMITGLEIKVGTNNTGNVIIGLDQLNANPPTEDMSVNLAITPIKALGTVSTIQRINPITNPLIAKGATVSLWASVDNAAATLRKGTGSSVKRVKTVTFANTLEYFENSAFGASSSEIYGKIYFNGVGKKIT